MGTGEFFQKIKGQWPESYHSHPFRIEVKNGGATPPLPQISSDVVLN
jgi:hypothetical protein